MAPYEYQPLPSPSTEIRLLRLLPGRGVIECHLKTVTLDDVEGIYEPISYCWQNSVVKEDETCSIVVDGHDLTLGQSLHDALRQMRRENMTRQLWADAICINQHDIGERNEQITLMAQIYGSGTRTLAWLGRADWWTPFAFRCLNYGLRECEKNPWVVERNEEWHKELVSREAVGGDGALKWARGFWNYVEFLGKYAALGSVMGRRYFTRSWILQEVSMSQQVLVMCGACEIDWDDMSIGLQWYEYSFAGCENFERVDYLRRNRAKGMSLPEVVREVSPTTASNPRDKLYSALGLVWDPMHYIHITVDYSLDCETIFSDFTKRVLETGGKLDALSMSRGISHSESSQLTGASWVWNPEPDGPSNQLSWPSPGSLFPFRAACDSVASPRFHGPMLGLDGYVLDQVTIIGPIYPSMTLKGTTYRNGLSILLDSVRPMSPWEVADLIVFYLASRNVAGLEDASADSEVMDQRRYIFRRTMDPWSHKYVTTDTDRSGFLQMESNDQFEVLDRELTRRFRALVPEKGQTTFMDWLLMCPSVISLIFQTAIGTPLAKTLDTFKSAHLNGRRLIRTEGGLIGLCPEITRPGDSIVLLQGSDVPFVLRAFGGRWRIVGECYVHEVMYGQAWDPSRCGSLWIT